MNAYCSNRDGFYVCDCKPGFFGDGFNCSDIDECLVDENVPSLILNHQNDTSGIRNDCHSDATCINMIGFYDCDCNTGFFGNGFNCSDIDECFEDIHDCDLNAFCTNTEGSFACNCIEGFYGNGTFCYDIDECNINKKLNFSLNSHMFDLDIDYGIINECSSNSICLNLFGSYNCSCNPGYSGDGFTCSDIDECSTSSHNCHMNAKCVNSDGAFECNCNEGFYGNGSFCYDIDECSQNLHNCDQYAHCQNFEGSSLNLKINSVGRAFGPGRPEPDRASPILKLQAPGSVSNSSGQSGSG